MKTWLTWTPRILGLLFAAFLSLFALDVFEQGYQGWETVLALLGEPTDSSSMTFAGLSGTASEWTRDDTTISIQFFNGKVKFKHFSKSSRKP